MLLTKCVDDDLALGKGLKHDLQTLKSGFDKLEKSLKDLESICDMHRRSLETYRTHIAHLERQQGTLDLSYQGEDLEFMS